MSQPGGQETPNALVKIKILATAVGASTEWLLGIAGASDFAESVAGGIFTVGTENVLTGRLSRLERRNSESVARRAIERTIERCADGEPLREDDFLADKPSSFEEAIEGGLMIAQRNYESRKLKYLGNLLASFAFDTTVDRFAANWCIRMAESLSWTQLVLLALANENEGHPSRAELTGGRDRSIADPTVWSVWEDWEDLYARRFIGMEHDDWSYRRGKAALPTRSMIWTIMPGGRTLVRLMELDAIPADDRAAVYEMLLRGSYGLKG